MGLIPPPLPHPDREIDRQNMELWLRQCSRPWLILRWFLAGFAVLIVALAAVAMSTGQ